MTVLRSVLVGVMGLALVGLAPAAGAVPGVPEATPAALVSGDIKSGEMRLTLAPEFTQQLLNWGATVAAIGGATSQTDDDTGSTIIRWRVQPVADGFSLTPGLAQAVVKPRGGLRITGNGTSVDLVDWNFMFSEAYGMMISVTAGSERPWVSTGVPIALPDKVRRNRLAFGTPAMTLNGTLADVLRGPTNAAGQHTGPVPGFTTEQIPFATAAVTLKVGR